MVPRDCEVIRPFRRLTALSGTILLPPPRVFAGMTLLGVSISCRKTPRRLARPALRLGRIGRGSLAIPGFCKNQVESEKGRGSSDHLIHSGLQTAAVASPSPLPSPPGGEGRGEGDRPGRRCDGTWRRFASGISERIGD